MKKLKNQLFHQCLQLSLHVIVEHLSTMTQTVQTPMLYNDLYTCVQEWSGFETNGHCNADLVFHTFKSNYKIEGLNMRIVFDKCVLSNHPQYINMVAYIPKVVVETIWQTIPRIENYVRKHWILFNDKIFHHHYNGYFAFLVTDTNRAIWTNFQSTHKTSVNNALDQPINKRSHHQLDPSPTTCGNDSESFIHHVAKHTSVNRASAKDVSNGVPLSSLMYGGLPASLPASGTSLPASLPASLPDGMPASLPASLPAPPGNSPPGWLLPNNSKEEYFSDNSDNEVTPYNDNPNPTHWKGMPKYANKSIKQLVEVMNDPYHVEFYTWCYQVVMDKTIKDSHNLEIYKNEIEYVRQANIVTLIYKNIAEKDIQNNPNVKWDVLEKDKLTYLFACHSKDDLPRFLHHYRAMHEYIVGQYPRWELLLDYTHYKAIIVDLVEQKSNFLEYLK